MLEDGGFISDSPPLKLEIIEVPGESPHARQNEVINLVPNTYPDSGLQVILDPYPVPKSLCKNYTDFYVR
jgi:hypothetical protein